MLQSNLQTTGLFRLSKVLQLYPVSRSTWYAGVKSGRFPRPVKLGERATAWRADDIHALIAELSSKTENNVTEV